MLAVPSVNGFNELGKFNSFDLDCINWPAFPYKPKVRVSVGHTPERMLVRFDVKEKNARAVCLEANGPVWEDSCVEFFVKLPDDPHYFNFETNCIGVGLAARRLSREDCAHLDAAQMEKIVRRSSLPRAVTDLQDAAWSLELEVPFEILGCKECPERLLANFYKCGDKTAEPHFLSWAPIKTQKPDFHRPEFFKILALK